MRAFFAGVLWVLLSASAIAADLPELVWSQNKASRGDGNVYDLMLLGDALYMHTEFISEADEISNTILVVNAFSGKEVLKAASGRKVLTPARFGDILCVEDQKTFYKGDGGIDKEVIALRYFDLSKGAELFSQNVPKDVKVAYDKYPPRDKRVKSDLPRRVGGLSWEGNTVYDYGGDGGFVWVHEAFTGKKYWERELGGIIDADPILADGVLYVGDGSYLWALDAKTGEDIGKKKFSDGWIEREPAITGDSIYVTDTVEPREYGDFLPKVPRYRLYKLDKKTWKELWRFEAEVMTGPVVENDRVYFGSWDNNLYALDANTGKETWRFRADGEINETPVISGSMLYFTTGKTVYALKIR
ncbi:hypothetical protein EPN96_05780 [bacterium]|nr:MAG: hypothetical protein EPN96_05780 [bacterium]